MEQGAEMSGGQCKTVYVLGAGFSAAAGFPMQGKILELLLEPSNYIKKAFFQDSVAPELSAQMERIKQFLNIAFPVDDGRQMEDIFTLLDQMIDIRGSFAGFSLEGLIALRLDWIGLITTLFHRLSSFAPDSKLEIYRRFIEKLLYDRICGNHPHESVSVISLNWDGLFENVFDKVVAEHVARGKADIDYCVYTVPLIATLNHHEPSTQQKAKGICNCKLLKLHGSTTWLRCPASNRIYTSIGLSPEEDERYCSQVVPSPLALEYSDSREKTNLPELEPFLVTPTFEKVFDLPHIQNVWQNAYLELRQATKVVFIGYSLPEADYHFKTLARRAIRPSTEIDVVLCDRDRHTQLTDFKGQVPFEYSVEARFVRLFGRERIRSTALDEKIGSTVFYNGFEGFVEREAPLEKREELRLKLKELLGKYPKNENPS